jgi:thiaminase/transcriptional activator TenA
MSFAASLSEAVPDLWASAVQHPFVRAVGDGTLPRPAFHRWIVQDHLFLQALARFVESLTTSAPATDRAGLRIAATMLRPEFELFQAYAAREGFDLATEPYPECAAFESALASAAAAGYTQGLAAYYACERSLLEAWSFARGLMAGGSPYSSWVDGWSSSEFAAFVRWIGERLDAAPVADAEELTTIVRRILVCEIALWDACLKG